MELILESSREGANRFSSVSGPNVIGPWQPLTIFRIYRNMRLTPTRLQTEQVSSPRLAEAAKAVYLSSGSDSVKMSFGRSWQSLPWFTCRRELKSVPSGQAILKSNGP